MSVAIETTNVLRPHYGYEGTILSPAAPHETGHMYYAKDTHRLFFDMGDSASQCLGVRSEGVIFVYGNAYTEENKPADCKDLYYIHEINEQPGVYKYPRNKIEGHFNNGDIIININDGSFYKIITPWADPLYVHCELLMVAGSGGTKEGIQLRENTLFPDQIAYGQEAVGSFVPVSYEGHTSGTIYAYIYRDENASQYVTYKSYRARVNEATVVVIEADELVPGDGNWIKVVFRTSDGMESVPLVYQINCVDLTFELDTNSWNSTQLFSATTPVSIPWRAYTVKSTVPANLSIGIDWTFADKNFDTEYTKFVQNQVNKRSFAEITKDLPQGTYRVTAKAHAYINGTKVSIGSIDLEIPWVVEGDENPVIWSNNFPQVSTIPKFTLISIEYMVYDPVAVANNKTTVKTYLSANNVIVEEEGRDIAISGGIATDLWDVAEYNEGDNVFTITCRSTTKAFYVTIVPNPDMQLDPVSTGCVMWFNAKGRSNNESESRRASWPNKMKVDDAHFAAEAIPVLTGFNWYNNGWQKDKDGYNVLRLSNGAKVSIPYKDLLSFQNRTYEFDFKVHNAINYSKLINITTVYETNEDGSLKLDDNGKPIPKVEKDAAGNEHEVVQKTASDGEGAFLSYYDGTQGYMLGTQEAFFAYSEHDITNVRYADDTRVKISFVVRYNDKRIENTNGTITPIEKYIYIYIDGVLSAAYPISVGPTSMNCKASALEINSDYCDVDIYNIRVYDTALDYNGIVTNWIGDSSTLQIMSEKYIRNNLTVGSGINTTIDYEKVKKSGLIPTLVLTTYGDGSGTVQDLLPYKKGDKRMCGARYYDPFDLSKNFHGYNFELDVQGTSSQGYPRRNFKMKTKQYDDKLPFYFEQWDGVEENKDVWVSYAEDASDADKLKRLKKWNLGHGVPETTFCLKADYMESSSSHNTGLANLVADIQAQYNEKDAYDFRHPLTRRHGENSRTTIYGYPILVFHEQKKIVNGVEENRIEFIGKYNFNIDKGATDSFGFTSGTINENSEAIYPEYIECKVADKKGMYPVILATDENGELKRDASTNGLYYIHPEGNKEKPLLDGDDKPITALGPGSYEQVAECWEFTQNQPGPGKFQEQIGGFYATDTNTGKIIAADHFEMRYHYADFDDPYESNDTVTANALFTKYSKNLAKMVDWVASTDVSVNADAIGNIGKILPAPKRYHTRDTEYVEGHVYYESTDSPAPYDVGITETIILSDTTNLTLDTPTFLEQLKSYAGAVFGDYSISYQNNAWRLDYIKTSDDGLSMVCLDEDIGDLANWGLTLSNTWGTATILFSYIQAATRWNANLYQEYTHDTKEYRLAKFKDEFKLHFNLSHTLFYFIMTELLLLYDSRQKNMMMASWGPELDGGEYIWYPIFYDMDTQLGVNNSGQVYWDYDTEATPKDNPDASIFSGTGSVLWANVSACFDSEIKLAYRLLRQYSSRLHISTLTDAYNTKQSDKWSEQMKNIDAFYKYIAPTDEDYGGFINTSGEVEVSGTYVYCLQGDRKLNRNAFFRNRLNYIDSQWLGGDYDPSKMSNAITMRYNLNEISKTSDGMQSEVDGTAFNGDPDYKIVPFLTQYVSVAYDQIPADPVRFDIANDSVEYAHIKAPETIRNRADAGVALTQQLAYVYGPQYISDLGDLSDKYLNVFQAEGAVRLRSLRIGNDKPGYKNTQFTDLNREENDASKSSAKTLLQEIDFSNLAELAGVYKVNGCLKLKSFKALGTKLTQVPFAQGSLLEKVYFPASITQLQFEAPLSLNNIITDKNRVSWVKGEDDVWVHNNDNGLYVENLTNMLTSTIGESNGSYTNINYYQMDNTKMGYDTYKMLKYLYDLKKKVRDNKIALAEAAAAGELTDAQKATQTWTNKTDSELRIQVLNAQWTPYERVEVGISRNPLTTYYVLNDDLTYSVYEGDNWDQDLKDFEIFKKVRENSPIENLAMLKTFIDDFNRTTCKIGNTADPYTFRHIENDPVNETNKLLPIITGNLHVNNTASTKIKEIDLYDFYGATGRFDELKITAEYIDPCYRAKFIEYNTDGGITTHGWQRSATQKTIAYNGDKPERLYYDFLGWAYDSEELRANQSIGTPEDVVLGPDGTTWVVGASNTTLTTPGETVTLVAVFRLTKWKISFVDGDGNPLINKTDKNNPVPYWEFSTIEAITPPLAVPSKNESELPVYDCYKFMGYTTSPDDVSNYVDFSKAIYPVRDMAYYAQFEQVNVYDNPLPLEQLHWQRLSDGTIGVALNAKYERKGKICVPSTLMINDISYDVTEILGSSLVDNLGVSQTSGFAGTLNLTHVFFQGTQDNTCKIRTLGDYAFQSSSNIVHLDIPASLTKLGSYCLGYTSSLKLTNLKNIVYFGYECLRGTGISSTVTNADTLYVSGNVNYLDTGSFRGIKYWHLQIGTTAQPLQALPVVPSNVSNMFDFWFDEKEHNTLMITIFTTMNEEMVEDFFKQCVSESASVEFDIQSV